MSYNDDVFSVILASHIEVALPSFGKTVKLKCRRLPFTTFMKLLVEISQTLQNEVTLINKTLGDEFGRLVANMQHKDGAGNSVVTAAEVTALFRLALPLIVNVVAKVPSISEMLLKDIVLDATPEVLSALPVCDVTAIIADVFDTIDIDIIAEHVARVFTRAATIQEKAVSLRGKTLETKQDASELS